MRNDIGDGDRCPIVPSHGQMLVIPGANRQYCPDQSHDGPWKANDKELPTRTLWPLQYFDQAVEEYEEAKNGHPG